MSILLAMMMMMLMMMIDGDGDADDDDAEDYFPTPWIEAFEIVYLIHRILDIICYIVVYWPGMRQVSLQSFRSPARSGLLQGKSESNFQGRYISQRHV